MHIKKETISSSCDSLTSNCHYGIGCIIVHVFCLFNNDLTTSSSSSSPKALQHLSGQSKALFKDCSVQSPLCVKLKSWFGENTFFSSQYKLICKPVHVDMQQTDTLDIQTLTKPRVRTCTDLEKASREFLPLAPVILCWLPWMWFTVSPNNPDWKAHRCDTHTHTHIARSWRAGVSNGDRKTAERLNSAEIFLSVRLVPNVPRSLHTAC